MVGVTGWRAGVGLGVAPGHSSFLLYVFFFCGGCGKSCGPGLGYKSRVRVTFLLKIGLVVSCPTFDG